MIEAKLYENESERKINEDDSKKLMKDLLETEFEGVLLKLLENNGINDRIQSLAFINDLIVSHFFVGTPL